MVWLMATKSGQALPVTPSSMSSRRLRLHIYVSAMDVFPSEAEALDEAEVQMLWR